MKELCIRKKKSCILMLVMLLLGSLFLSCKKLIKIDAPFSTINVMNVYNNDDAAAQVLNGIYTQMSSDNIYNFNSTGVSTNLSILLSLSADELNLHRTNSSFLTSLFQNNLRSQGSPDPLGYWNDYYKLIFRVNSAIEGLNQSNMLSNSVKMQLMGEAKFMRGFYYFYLVNLYGDAPLVLTTDYQINSLLPRSSKHLVYEQIISDLTEAYEMLSTEYLSGNVKSATTERVRPNKWAAAAMLARVYLYNSQFDKAIEFSNLVINNKGLFELEKADKVFLKESREFIWQLQPVGEKTQANTGEAKYFVLPKTGPTADSDFPVSLSRKLVNSFSTGDARKFNWLDSVITASGVYCFSKKYKTNDLNATGEFNEYIGVLRLAEQYLIRSEAETQLNQLGAANEDLRTIRKRAGLTHDDINDKNKLLEVILHERNLEFFTEWGHRWLDLKRTGKVDEVMSADAVRKGGSWDTNMQWYPISLSELRLNPKLVQNQGY